MKGWEDCVWLRFQHSHQIEYRCQVSDELCLKDNCPIVVNDKIEALAKRVDKLEKFINHHKVQKFFNI